MNCPGSNALLKYVGELTESDEPDYRRDGTCAHAGAALCLASGQDGWELIGTDIGGTLFTLEMAQAIQVYLDAVRSHTWPDSKLMIEFGISSPIHPLFYGTLDCAYVSGLTAWLFDYKHGEGLVVEVEENPQFMYYAYGLLEVHPEVTEFIITVVQPRIVFLEPVRTWTVSADRIRAWARDVLVPAMDQADMNDKLDAGPWCRFCPAKLVCPLLTGLFRAAAVANPKELVNISNERIGEHYRYLQAVDHYKKALQEEVFNRSMKAPKSIPGTKLVNKKADRVFKPGSDIIFKSRYGEKAFTRPELKSPAQMEAIDADAKDLVHEYAYTPQSGLTVALATDKRPEAQPPKPLSETFAGALNNV